MKDLIPTQAKPVISDDNAPAWHPYANLFPMMDFNSDAFIKLIEDIRDNGMLQPIVLFEGQVLDGRNRLAACTLLGIEPEYVDYVGSDPIQFVTSQNLHRRHLTPSQQAMVGARILEIFEAEGAERQREGGKRFGRGHPKSEEKLVALMPQAIEEEESGIAPKSRDHAAALVGVSPRSVANAKVVQEAGIPELQAAVDANAIKVSEAAHIATMPPGRQAEIIQLPKKERQAAVKTEVTEMKAERIRLDDGVNKEFTKIYSHFFFRIRDLSNEIAAIGDPETVAESAINSFPHHIFTFCDELLPHISRVAKFIHILSQLNEARDESRKSTTA